MIELTSTPIIILAILGGVGVALPVINVALKERGSMISYGIVTLIALFAAIGYVFYQLALDHVAPAAIFSQASSASKMPPTPMMGSLPCVCRRM